MVDLIKSFQTIQNILKFGGEEAGAVRGRKEAGPWPGLWPLSHAGPLRVFRLAFLVHTVHHVFDHQEGVQLGQVEFRLYPAAEGGDPVQILLRARHGAVRL